MHNFARPFSKNSLRNIFLIVNGEHQQTQAHGQNSADMKQQHVNTNKRRIRQV